MENGTIEEHHMSPGGTAKAGEQYALEKRDEATIQTYMGPPHIHKRIARTEARGEFDKLKTEPTENFQKTIVIISTHVADPGKMDANQVAEIITLRKIRSNDRPGQKKEVRIWSNINLTPTDNTSVPELDVPKADKVVLATAGGTRSNGAVLPSEWKVSEWITDKSGKGKDKGKE